MIERAYEAERKRAEALAEIDRAKVITFVTAIRGVMEVSYIYLLCIQDAILLECIPRATNPSHPHQRSY